MPDLLEERLVKVGARADLAVVEHAPPSRAFGGLCDEHVVEPVQDTHKRCQLANARVCCEGGFVENTVSVSTGGGPGYADTREEDIDPVADFHHVVGLQHSNVVCDGLVWSTEVVPWKIQYKGGAMLIEPQDLEHILVQCYPPTADLPDAQRKHGRVHQNSIELANEINAPNEAREAHELFGAEEVAIERGGHLPLSTNSVHGGRAHVFKALFGASKVFEMLQHGR